MKIDMLGKSLESRGLSDLATENESYLLIYSSEVNIQKEEIKNLISNGMENWIIFGQSADQVNQLFDNAAREINCDEVPAWSWELDYRHAINRGLRSESKKIVIVASPNELNEIEEYIDSLSNKKIEDIKTTEEEIDNSGKSKFLN